MYHPGTWTSPVSADEDCVIDSNNCAVYLILTINTSVMSRAEFAVFFYNLDNYFDGGDGENDGRVRMEDTFALRNYLFFYARPRVRTV